MLLCGPRRAIVWKSVVALMSRLPPDTPRGNHSHPMRKEPAMCRSSSSIVLGDDAVLAGLGDGGRFPAREEVFRSSGRRGPRRGHRAVVSRPERPVSTFASASPPRRSNAIPGPTSPWRSWRRPISSSTAVGASSPTAQSVVSTAARRLDERRSRPTVGEHCCWE